MQSHQHRRCDLSTRDEIAEFVIGFYREIAQDDRFRQWFEAIAHIDWHAHTTELSDFWAGLDGPHRRADEVIEADQWLRETDAFDGALFERWPELFDATLDEAGAARSPRPLVSRLRGRCRWEGEL